MKVVSVGCSFTAGLGVSITENYTHQLSNQIGCYFENWGESGHSNQYIFRKTIELLKNWDSNDILIIQWTNPNRQEISTNEGYLFYPPYHNWMSLAFLYGKNPQLGLEKIGIFDKDEFEKKIIKEKSNDLISYCNNFYNEEYQNTISFCFQYSLYGLLKHLNIKFLMFFGWEFDNFKKDIFSLTDDSFLKETFGTFTNTIKNEHPNADAHKIWSKHLYENLKKLNYINKNLI